MSKQIVVLQGDGIGPEIVREAIRVIETLGDIFDDKVSFKFLAAGGESIDKYDSPLLPDVLAQCKEADAILKGPFGGPRWDKLPTDKRPEKGILDLRKNLELFANLRPVKLFDSLIHASTIKPEVIEGIDILIVRELTSGLYFGEPRGIKEQDGVRIGFNTLIYRDFEVKRILEKSFEYAKLRRKKVHSVDKFNVLESSRLWHEVADEVAIQYPEVAFEHVIVDNCAMQLISNPKQFDVVVTTNMFGDILSDEASMLTGSLGMLPSASLGGGVGLYEPSHGSAPTIAGQNKANPLATILSVAMMYQYSFQNLEAKDMIEKAVDAFLKDGYRTADIMEKNTRLAGTRETGDYLVNFLKKQ